MPAGAALKAERRHRTYWLALGRFSDLFGKVEAAAQLVLSHYGKMPFPVARALFGPLRVDDTVIALRRILAVRGDIDQAIADDLNDVLAQLLLINRVWNDIPHCETHAIDEGFRLIPNGDVEDCTSAVANAEAPIRNSETTTTPSPISLKIIEAMHFDLQKILGHFLVRHIDRPMFNRDQFESVFHCQWRYKRRWRQTSRLNRQRPRVKRRPA
jgi:hypothetical protein